MEELLPDNAPEPLGKPVTLTHFVDANLMHDLSTGRSLTGILHLANKTPIEWFSKKQATVEVATHYMRRVTTSGITNPLSTAVSNSMQSCTSDTTCFHFILSAKPLPPDTSSFCTFRARSIPLISSASIGVSLKLGPCSKLSFLRQETP